MVVKLHILQLGCSNLPTSVMAITGMIHVMVSSTGIVAIGEFLCGNIVPVGVPISGYVVKCCWWWFEDERLHLLYPTTTCGSVDNPTRASNNVFVQSMGGSIERSLL